MKGTNKMGMQQKASLIASKEVNAPVALINNYHVECLDSEGNLKWEEDIKNLVTTQGLNYILETSFTGDDTAITSWFVGLKGTGTPAAADAAAQLPSGTMAWTEYEGYDSATRPALTLGSVSAGSVDNSGNVASFTIASPGDDVYGVFIVDANGKGTNTSATVLYGVGDFAGAPKVVDTNDTLNVTVTLSAASA
jgi:hypothetical protein